MSAPRALPSKTAHEIKRWHRCGCSPCWRSASAARGCASLLGWSSVHKPQPCPATRGRNVLDRKHITKRWKEMHRETVRQFLLNEGHGTPKAVSEVEKRSGRSRLPQLQAEKSSQVHSLQRHRGSSLNKIRVQPTSGQTLTQPPLRTASANLGILYDHRNHN